jgi:hypothetical protein
MRPGFFAGEDNMLWRPGFARRPGIVGAFAHSNLLLIMRIIANVVKVIIPMMVKAIGMVSAPGSVVETHYSVEHCG